MLLNNSNTAKAYIKGGREYPRISGVATFKETKNGVLLIINAYGLPEADGGCKGRFFGMHIHEGNPCSGTSEDEFANSKGHYNPNNCVHPYHVGDLPPLLENNGYAYMSVLLGRINIKDINFNDCKMNVIGKGNKERSVYLNESCQKAIAQYIAVRPKDAKDKDALFLSERGTRIGKRTVEMLVKKYITLAGLDPKKYSPHKLRHTAATLMHKYGGVDIRSLQQILGHESVSTTEIYTHVDSEQVKEALEKNPLNNM